MLILHGIDPVFARGRVLDRHLIMASGGTLLAYAGIKENPGNGGNKENRGNPGINENRGNGGKQ